MRLKRILAGVLAAVMTIACAEVPFVATTETVEAATNLSAVRTLKVNYTDVLQTATVGEPVVESVYADYSSQYEKNFGSFSYMYQFTLDEVSFVNISTTAKVFTLTNVGDYELYLGTSASNTIYKIGWGFADGKNNINYQSALEAGTYYIKMIFSHKGNAASTTNFITDGTASISVSAKRIKRTGNTRANTKATAIPVKSSVAAYGAITGITKRETFSPIYASEQYFKIVLPVDSPLSVSAVIERFGDLNISSIVVVEVMDSTGRKVGKTISSYYKTNSADGEVGTLPKGTYYAKVTYPEFCSISFTAKYQQKISKLKITAKKNKKSVTVKTIAQATVKVKIGKKTYKGKSNKSGKAVIKVKKLKKKIKVKVTVSKSGYKTASKTVKVK